MSRFYVHEFFPDEDERFDTREQAEAFAADVGKQWGPKIGDAFDVKVRVGEVLSRREREARDAVLAAADGFVTFQCTDGWQALEKAVRVYRAAKGAKQ